VTTLDELISALRELIEDYPTDDPEAEDALR
jgi:hypothetical protein